MGTSLRPRISPLTRLIFFNEFMKYQNLDLAITSLGAKIRILQIGGLAWVAVGFLRPITLKNHQYSNQKEKKVKSRRIKILQADERIFFLFIRSILKVNLVDELSWLNRHQSIRNKEKKHLKMKHTETLSSFQCG